ncbi:hypothetical protein [Leptothrix discophora]|uniref:Uncharacterized protein n=1 Tax=Leptothrix discophora TaxID=89 RepID=A0ABT9G8L3_LEPDI|nr:hypothetical protein [Leptothrix discophora]MDP4302829.1 hypothetical protein [Leptothrix discophora]
MSTTPQNPESPVTQVIATVLDVMPQVGLAYLEDGEGVVWGVTRSTPGVAFDTLAIGLRLRLAITRQGSHALVASACRDGQAA